MPPIIDRYLWRRMQGAFCSLLALILLAMSIETLPRLLAATQQVSDRAPVVIMMLTDLIPEYLAVGLPIATFLATALAFRRLTLEGELDALVASGCSHWRLVRMPLILGLASAILLIGLRGYVEPAGERQLDAIGGQVRTGAFGYRIEPGQTQPLSGGSHLFFTRVDGEPDRLRGVLIQSGNVAIVAAEARLRFAADGGLVATISRGHVIRRTRDGAPSVGRFDSLRAAFPMPGMPAHASSSRRDRLDRTDLTSLLAGPWRQGSIGREAALASASTRLSAGLLCLALPLLGFVFGVPPKRSRSSLGLAAGLAGIILFWKISALIEDRFTAEAPLLHGGLILAFAAASLWLMGFQEREGLGAVEARLALAARAAGEAARHFLDRSTRLLPWHRRRTAKILPAAMPAALPAE